MSEPFGLSTLKIHFGPTQLSLLPGLVSAREKRSREEQWISAPMSVSPTSLQLLWESSGHWPNTAPVNRGEELGCGKKGS